MDDAESLYEDSSLAQIPENPKTRHMKPSRYLRELNMKYQAGTLGYYDMPTPKKLMELQKTINDDLGKASLPEIRIDGFKLPDQALEITFERETVTGENRDRLWEIINAHYKKLLRELELKE